MATIYDIAKAANTSAASVSRVINARGGVRAETVANVRKAMEALNFQPRLKAADRDRFLVFVPEEKKSFESGYVARIMSGIADEAFGAGYGLQLRPFLSARGEVRDLRQLYLQEAVSGCIIISLHQGYSLPERLEVARLPHVVVGHKKRDDDVHQILTDDFEAGREAAEFMLSLGHERVAMVSFSHVDHGHLDRYRGFAEALAKVGRKKPVCIQCNDANYAAGRSAARHLLSPIERPTAVIITNEDLAIGFQAEAREMKFHLPGDLSIIAFEESDKLSLLDPPMTAMQTPAYSMGTEAVKMLRIMIGAAKGAVKAPPKFMTKHMQIPLVARASAAVPHRARTSV